jgi:hypothetical protein
VIGYSLFHGNRSTIGDAFWARPESYSPTFEGSGKKEQEMSPSDGANRRRSERVMLRMSVVVETESAQHEKQREETHTLVVNAHGGLLPLKMEVLAGQPIVLINSRSGAREAARVVRVENPPGGYIAVAFEFDRPSPKFWPVEFPPDDWEKANS